MSNDMNNGSSVQDNGTYGATQNQQPACPKDHLVGNIVLTVLGSASCIGLILGIIGIVFSSQVKSKYAGGDYAGAESASSTARIMFIINLILTIVAAVVWIIYIIAVVILASNSYYW